jgi:hypothetical protein
MIKNRLFGRLANQSRFAIRRTALHSAAAVEQLECRRMLTLLGVQPGYPLVSVTGSAADGTAIDYSYDGTTSIGTFDLSTTPFGYTKAEGDTQQSIFEGTLTLQFKTNAAGQVVGGIDNAPDFVIQGLIDLNNNGALDDGESGVLLTGELVELGSSDVPNSNTDFFDFRLTATGGHFAADYTGKDIGISLTSENSTFAGRFDQPFTGVIAKGDVGPIPPRDQPTPDIDIEKYIKAATNPTGGEGKTPGFWKQSQHFFAWTSPYVPTGPGATNYNAVFGLTAAQEDPALTLLAALGRGGGEENALGRHAAAALLNAANPNISYLYSTSQIIALVQNAYATGEFEHAKNLLAQQNELEADLSTPAPPSGFPAGLGADADTVADGLNVAPGTQLMFTLVVTNPGQTPLAQVTIIDDNGTPGNTADDRTFTTPASGDTDNDGLLDVGETWTYSYVTTAVAGTITNNAVVTGKNAFNLAQTVTDEDPANYATGTQPPPPDQPKIDIEKYVKANVAINYEGKTPGYWKQSQHFDDWVGYSPSDKFKDVFGVTDPSCNKNLTLLQALQRGGGGYEALGRHAVAALLNASHPNIAYLYSKPEVIAMVQQAIATKQYDATKNLFEKQNELEADLSSPVPQSTPGYGVDADTLATGLNVAPGTSLTFTLVVTNPGQTPLSDVVIVDDNGTPSNPADDRVFTTPASGDANNDGILQVGETWVYSYTTTAVAGQSTNTAAVTAKNVFNTSQVVTDEDPANYYTSTTDDNSCWDPDDKAKFGAALAYFLKYLSSKC